VQTVLQIYSPASERNRQWSGPVMALSDLVGLPEFIPRENPWGFSQDFC
jgi:hypothetical protein